MPGRQHESMYDTSHVDEYQREMEQLRMEADDFAGETKWTIDDTIGAVSGILLFLMGLGLGFLIWHK